VYAALGRRTIIPYTDEIVGKMSWHQRCLMSDAIDAL
jgi:hypothetical protein